MKNGMLLVTVGLVIASFARAQEPESRPKPDAEAEVSKLEALVDAATAKKASGKAQEALADCDAAVVKFHEVFDAFGGQPTAALIAAYKELIALSDGLVEQIETPEQEGKIAERDLLAAKERAPGPWGASKGAKLTWSERELSIEGVPIEGGPKVMGVVSVLPAFNAGQRTSWNDLVIDLEFTIQAGEFEVYLRYWPDKRSYRIRFSPTEGYDVGKTYRMTLKVKGSTISLKQPDQPENRDKMDATTSRTGGIGFGLQPGSKVVLSQLNMKVLR
jgi:hypothetical protein